MNKQVKKLRPDRRGARKKRKFPTEPLEFDPEFNKLLEPERRLMEKFCREYLKDLNGAAAVLRMGYKWKSGYKQRAWTFLEQPYVQYYLSHLSAKLDEKSIITRGEIILGLKREANYFEADSTHSARISAFRTLAKILGMDLVKTDENEQAGVMVVPLGGSVDEWEKNCVEAQEKLKAKAKE